MDLKNALLQERVATQEELDEAAARQVLYGGDLITNLLDRRPVEESGAQRALCRAHAHGPAPQGALPRASAASLELLPLRLAARHGVYPLRVEGNVLALAAGAPLPAATQLALRGARNVQLEVLLTLDVRVKQALARDNALALEAREHKALARLEQRAMASSLPPNPLLDAPSFSVLPKAPSITPLPFPKLWAEAETPTEAQFAAETAPLPRVRPRTVPPISERSAERSGRSPDRGPDSDGRSRARRRGPYTGREAQLDLQQARSAEEVLQVYFDYAAQYFDYTAIFSLQGGAAQLREVRGVPGPQNISVGAWPFDEHPALRLVSQEPRWRLLSLQRELPSLAQMLAVHGPEQALLLPVRVRQRATLLLVGGCYQADVELGEIGDLFAFEPLVAQAIERVIVLRKAGPDARAQQDGTRPSELTPGPSSSRARSSAPPSDRSNQALVRALAAEGRNATPPPAKSDSEPPKQN